jgi:hypothetical protein
MTHLMEAMMIWQMKLHASSRPIAIAGPSDLSSIGNERPKTAPRLRQVTQMQSCSLSEVWNGFSIAVSIVRSRRVCMIDRLAESNSAMAGNQLERLEMPAQLNLPAYVSLGPIGPDDG